jgi:hypothetical protein
MQPTFGCSFLRKIIAKAERVLGAGWTTWAMSNQDNVRIVSRFDQSADLGGNDRALAKLLLSALLSIRGERASIKVKNLA